MKRAGRSQESRRKAKIKIIREGRNRLTDRNREEQEAASTERVEKSDTGMGELKGKKMGN